MPNRKKSEKPIPLFFDTYLAVIRNSVGSGLFRNLYAKVGGRKTDLLRNGKLSCAFYVSSILKLFDLIGGIHATVDSTIDDLRRSGWSKVTKPEAGSVLVWERLKGHKHIGFFIGAGRAVSNRPETGFPSIHGWEFDSRRKVEAVFRHPKFFSKKHRRVL
ncbi:MAG TPA: hypothetical protein VNK70_00965 [Candidatus Paceibacterota bacterium]|nr:hypothetical protein [Candidatus Paceibacterota bacterium]